MLWDVVYEFFVKYIFGGRLSNTAVFNGALGQVYVSGEGWTNITTAQSTYVGAFNKLMPIGNYFAMIATIITMVVIVLICCALIKKIYNMCAHIIG